MTSKISFVTSFFENIPLKLTHKYVSRCQTSNTDSVSLNPCSINPKTL